MTAEELWKFRLKRAEMAADISDWDAAGAQAMLAIAHMMADDRIIIERELAARKVRGTI